MIKEFIELKRSCGTLYKIRISEIILIEFNKQETLISIHIRGVNEALTLMLGTTREYEKAKKIIDSSFEGDE